MGNGEATTITLYITKKQKRLLQNFCKYTGYHISQVFESVMLKHMLETLDSFDNSITTDEIKKQLITEWRK